MKSIYAIVCGSRSGSSYLCDLLSSTNRCGRPEEYFNKDLDYKSKFGIDLDDENYTKTIIEQTKTENSVFGVKIVGLDQWSNYQNSDLVITHWIRLHRKDIILQAISRYKAWKTNKWHISSNELNEDLEYNKQGIQWCLEEIIKENLFYDQIFSDIDHLDISYEDDLLENPNQTVNSILYYLEISLAELPNLKTSQVIRRDFSSYSWKSKFLSEVEPYAHL